MSYEGIVLGIFFYSITVMSFIGEACAENKYYSLTTTHKETDEKVYYNVYHQKTLFGMMKNAIVDMLPNICNIRWNEKLKFCHDILEADENGFYLSTSYAEHLNCNNESLLVHFLTLSTVERSTTFIFYCPRICYQDLETNERICLEDHTHVVSKALEHNSASIFVRKDSLPEWYPQHHVADIDFKRIERSTYESETINPVTEANDEDLMTTYLQAKRMSSPYEKFRRFYLSINLCSRRKADKVYLCLKSIEEAFNTKNIQFDLFGYDEHACKKYDISPVEENENHSQGHTELTMVRCPPIEKLSIHILPTRKYFDLYYISSNLKQNSTTLFIRRNKKGKLPTQEANIENLPMNPITKDIRRWRFLPAAFTETKYQKNRREKSYQEIEAELINSTEGDVRMPSTLVRLGETKLQEMLQAAEESQPTLNKWVADDSVIAFSKVKRMKFIYQRFKETYRSIDIGQLSTRQRALLCNDALKYYETPELIYRLEETYVIHGVRKRVRLTRREIDGLETNTFLLFQCPCDLLAFFGLYFIGKNHLENTATIYTIVRIKSETYYYPHAFIYGINRHKLAHFVLHD